MPKDQKKKGSIMSVEKVLFKIRQIKDTLKYSTYSLEPQCEDFPFQPLVELTASILQANTYLVSASGEILGLFTEFNNINSERTLGMMNSKQLTPDYMQLIRQLDRTLENISIDDERTIFAEEIAEEFPNGKTAIIPMSGSNRIIGYFILARPDSTFDDSDMILAEYVATVLAIELDHHIMLEKNKKSQKRDMIAKAINSLSYSELNAIRIILEFADSPSFNITASRIAEDRDITRSVIVNALRKLESAGVLMSQSLGTKGTYIDLFSEENLSMLREGLNKSPR